MVTFETKVWEQDWKYILKGDYLDKMIRDCNYEFDQKNLIINNVKDRKKVAKYAEIKKSKGIIDNYYFAEDYADVVLKHFEIDKEKFNGGYYYSIAELTGIFLCKTKYLLHLSSDSLIVSNKTDWISDTLKVFDSRDDIIIANPIWNFNYQAVTDEMIEEIDDNFYIGFGFTDQCYLIKKDIFFGKIYNEYNIESDRYPKYGGELFEKRVDSYMRNNNLHRIIHKHKVYIHQNFTQLNYIYKLLPFLIKKTAKKRFRRND